MFYMGPYRLVNAAKYNWPREFKRNPEYVLISFG